jgi:hypothetical protein
LKDAVNKGDNNMIRKADLLEAIDCLTVQIALQGDRIHQLEDKVFGDRKKARKMADERRIKKASKQPRTKDGKFAKKK